MKSYERKQDLVTMRIPREIRDNLKVLAKKETRSMVGQLAYMLTQQGVNNGK